MNYKRRNRTAGKWIHSERTNRTNERESGTWVWDTFSFPVKLQTTKPKQRQGMTLRKKNDNFIGKERIRHNAFKWEVCLLSGNVVDVFYFFLSYRNGMGCDGLRGGWARGWELVELMERLIFPFSFSRISDTVAHITQPVKPVSHPTTQSFALFAVSTVSSLYPG